MPLYLSRASGLFQGAIKQVPELFFVDRGRVEVDEQAARQRLEVPVGDTVGSHQLGFDAARRGNITP